MKLTTEQVNSLYGRDVQDDSGGRIGSVAQVWADAAGTPTWVSVQVDKRREAMAPLGAASMMDGKLRVGYDKATVSSAPSVPAGSDAPLDAEQTTQLYRHYRMQPGQEPQRAPQGREDLIRSEERLRVGTESEPAGTAVLRKYVVTENVHTTVPVEHDEVRVEREPVTAADAGDLRADIGEAQQEMPLRAERPVVAKDRVPVERVHLAKDEVVEERPIDEQVRHEEMESDIPEPARRRR
ncbi:YsnF/AvaK domain-containing protein [Micromonospora sp. NPDC000207]|uniref:YsnF/AvaK domain-containing protein n=1 Tax=Micromonospora sp. NPDC000207 TaxID=3154246 RepID=UPI0033290D91